MDTELLTLAAQVVAHLKQQGAIVATAESCTGGLLSAALTSVPGSSAVFDRAFITYSNEAKTEMLGVPADLIVKHGAVSEEVAKAMAEGILTNASKVTVGVSITGIAGPDGGTVEKPVGLVYVGFAKRGEETEVTKLNLDGDRQAIRTQVVMFCLRKLRERI